MATIKTHVRMQRELVWLLLLTLLITLVGILPSLLQYGGVYLNLGDFSTEQIGFIHETKRMLSSGVPLWSWNTYFGDGFIGAYAFYTATSPFVWLDCLFPHSWMLGVITATLVLKMLCLAAATWAYLRKMQLTPHLAMLGSLLYCFSSFTLFNLIYYHFLEPMICLPLLLLAIEHHLNRGRHCGTWLALATGMTIIVNFYFAIGTLIVAALYFACRACALHARPKQWLWAAAMVLLGIGVACVVLLPVLAHLVGEPRVTASMGSLLHMGRTVLLGRLHALLFPEIGLSPLAFGLMGCNTYVPVFGCALALAWCTRHWRNWLTWLCVLLILCYLTPLNGVFTLFVNHKYTRWTFALVLVLVLASMKWLQEQSKAPTWLTACYVAGSLLFESAVFIYPWITGRAQASHFSFSDAASEVACALLFMASLVLIVIAMRKGWQKRHTGWVAAFCAVFFVVCTLICSGISLTKATPDGRIAVDHDADFNRVYWLNNNVERRPDSTRFHYRTNFMTRGEIVMANVGLAVNRPSVDGYNSNINNTVRPLMLKANQKTFPEINHFFPEVNVSSMQTLMSVRDIVAFTCDPKLVNNLTEPMVPLKQGDGYVVESNPHYVPMGFCYDHYIPAQAIDTLQGDVPLQLLQTLAIDDTTLAAKYMQRGKINLSANLDSVAQQRRRVTCSYFAGDTRGFSATIAMPRENLVFFSVPCDPGFTATIDGKPAEIHKVNLGLMAIVVPKGKHSIRADYMPPLLPQGAAVSLVAVIMLVAVAVAESRKGKVTRREP